MPVDVVLIPYVPEVPDLALGHEHGYTQRMNRGVSEPFVVEAPSSIEPIKVLLIRLTTKPIQITNFEVGEELAIIVVPTVVRI